MLYVCSRALQVRGEIAARGLALSLFRLLPRSVSFSLARPLAYILAMVSPSFFRDNPVDTAVNTRICANYRWH